MKKLFVILAGLAALALSSSAFAQCEGGFGGNCSGNQIQGQGQGQGQQQGQQQGQGQGQAQGQIANGGAGYGGHQAQGQIGINKNYNKNVALQGQLQGNVQGTKINQSYSAAGNTVGAFAPSISARSTAPCVITYAASGGNGGAPSTSIFSLGLHIPIKDDDCVRESMIRTGNESNDPVQQKLAQEMYEHQMLKMMEEDGHLKVSSVIDSDGNVQKVMYHNDLAAFVPVQSHPQYQRAAAVLLVDKMIQAGYTPHVNATTGSGFQRVSFDTGTDGSPELIFDEDMIESVINDVDDDGAKFVPVDTGDRN